jgi:hypothetical protein
MTSSVTGRLHYIMRDSLNNERHVLADLNSSPDDQALYQLPEDQMRLQSVQ